MRVYCGAGCKRNFWVSVWHPKAHYRCYACGLPGLNHIPEYRIGWRTLTEKFCFGLFRFKYRMWVPHN